MSDVAEYEIVSLLHDEEFVNEVIGQALESPDVMEELADDIAEDASPTVRDQMHAAFRRGIQLEWLFWDAAYRKEGWPI